MENKPAHSSIGASSAHRWMECPGSNKFIDEVAPPQETSVYAAEGTAAHELAEMCLNNDQNAEEFLGDNINGFEVTPGMAEAVQEYLDDIRFITERANEQEGVEVHTGCEDSICLSWIDEDAYGTLDNHIAIIGDTLYVHDYKHGQGVPVEAQDNVQLFYYTLGIAKKYDFNFKKYVATIVQPRAPHPEGPIRRFHFDNDRLMGFQDELIEAIQAVRDMSKLSLDVVKRDHLKAGDGCKFCPVKAGCPEIHKRVIAAAQDDFDAIDGDILAIEPTKPQYLGMERLSEILQFADTIEGWIKAVREYAQIQAEIGNIPPGMKLIKKAKHRKFCNEEGALDMLSFLGFRPEDLITPGKLKTPAQLEKINGMAREYINPLLKVHDLEVKLVPQSNPGRAIQPPAIAAFSVIEGDSRSEDETLKKGD